MSPDSVERWKNFCRAAGLDIPDDELARIAGSLDRITAATREALADDLRFIEPIICFRFPGGDA